MQVDGITNLGLNILSDVGLTQCARSLSNHRDLFADVGTQVMHSTAANFPYQSTIDNCDLQSEHLTVESVEKETLDTSSLSTTNIDKAAALKVFSKQQVLLGAEANKVEREHFMEVIGVAVGKVLASRRPEAKKLLQFLPAHHTHNNSGRKLTPAITFLTCANTCLTPANTFLTPAKIFLTLGNTFLTPDKIFQTPPHTLLTPADTFIKPAKAFLSPHT